jgi:coronin-1B/1C/6
MLCRFNPTVNGCLLSCSGDQTVKTWDVEKGEEIASFDGNHELTQDIVWSHNGDLVGTSCKDKMVRILDGRTLVQQQEFNAHEGTKSVKLTFLGASGLIATLGFTKQSQRELKIWDLKDTSKELKRIDIDQAAGAIMPFYDADTSMLYLAGKGDGNVRYYEISASEPFCFPLSEFRSTQSCKGACLIPKRSNNIMKCETARMLKLTPNDGVQPLNFIVPRKSDAFQDDIFPDSAAPIPAHSVDEWLAGSTKDPVLMSLDPSKQASGEPAVVKSKMVIKTVGTVSAELKVATDRIAELEAKLKAANIEF